MGLFGVVEEIRHKNDEFLYGALWVSDMPLLRQGVAVLYVIPPGQRHITQVPRWLPSSRRGVRVSCFYRDSCAKKAAAFFKKSIPRPGFAQLGFDFLVLGKLGRCHFLGLGSGMGFPPLVHPVSHGLRNQNCRTVPPQ